MPRRQTNLRGPRDRPEKKAPPKPKGRRGLDAFAIAEEEVPKKLGVRRNRLGNEEEFSNRKRNFGRDDEDSDDPGNKRRKTDERSDGSDGGSDGEGHEWKIGEVDSDNDSELDSDEAMGSSDEERFEGFTFRGSATTKDNQKKGSNKAKTGHEVNLAEDDDESEEEDYDEEYDDDFGEDGIDLTTAWDMNTAELEAKEAAAKAKKRPSDNFEESESEDADSEDSGDESGLSMSEGEDNGDESGLSKLQSFVNNMDTETAGQKPRKAGSSQEHGKPTEYGLTSSRKLTVADLLPSITDSRLKNSLKNVDSAVTQKGKSSGVPGKLDAPLAKRQQDRLDRGAAYDKSKETLNRWLETVKANRRAEHLMFPLPDPDAQHTHKMEVAKPQTDLEGTIQNILAESGLVAPDGKSNEDQIQEAEELQARKLPIEEIRARRAELRQRRDLLFREEVRAKRIKKIKSKSYRRRHRKEREKMEEQEKQALRDAGVDMDEEEREKNERRRAEARMGSKHRDSKWAKSLRQTGRTAWDEEARNNAADLALKEEELRKRIEGKRVSNADDDYLGSSSSESEEDDPWQEDGGSDAEKQKMSKKLEALEADNDDRPEIKGPHSNLFSMKFMQNAEASRKVENDAEIRRLNRELNGEESESDADSEVGRRKFGHPAKKDTEAKPKPQPKNEFEEAPGSDDETYGGQDADQDIDIVVDRPQKQGKKGPATKAPPARSASGPSRQEEPPVEENPWLVQTNRNNRRPETDVQETVDIAVDESKPKAESKDNSKQQKPKKPASRKETVADDNDSDDEGNVPVLLKNHDLVKRAFAGDEVVQDFEQDKLDTIEDEGDKVIDETLPGWGSWTGEGVSKKQKKKQKRQLTTVEGVKPENRKDAKLARVIINEKRVKKNNKYMAPQLPHPFESKAQYERSLRLPIGPEWSTKDTFQDSTKPRVMIKQGIIKPLEKPMI